jgi:precorrin-6B methylase 2
MRDYTLVCNRHKGTINMGDEVEYTNQIEGWMSDVELNWLYKRALEMDSIVEIGSWKGKSTSALLSACKGTVTAIDHFKGSDGEEAHKEARVKDIFLGFMDNVGKFKNLRVLRMSSDDAVDKVEKVDMIFIDGAHTYEQVKKDIKNYLPKARKLICGHDYVTSVKQAVDEVLGEVKTVGTIWYRVLG